MDIISLIIALLALILSVLSFSYAIKKDRRNFVLNQLVEIKNNVLKECDNLEKINVFEMFLSSLTNFTDQNSLEIFENFNSHRPEVSKSCSNIIMYLSMVKQTKNLYHLCVFAQKYYNCMMIWLIFS